MYVAVFNILNGLTPKEILRRKTYPMFVIKKGRIIAENHVERKLYLT